MDFTLKKYSELLNALKDTDYCFITFERHCSDKAALSNSNFVILRHDVDQKPENALTMAKKENVLGVKASYYFRAEGRRNNSEIIKAIAELGHEIGYHYEDMTMCKGDAKKAMSHFEEELACFRQLYPVKTVCMHGAPRSRYDNRELWKRFDYHQLGVMGEPYFDVDYSKVFYLTDTGRRWDGFRVSLRDKVSVYQEEWVRQGLVYHSTDDIMKAIGNGSFPKRLMMTTHPQRWTDDRWPWFCELVAQSVKNMVKWVMVMRG